MGVYSEAELKSHYDIKLEKYAQVLNIEVATMLEMVFKDILPAAFKYMADLRHLTKENWAASRLYERLEDLVNELYKLQDDLSKAHAEAKEAGDLMAVARAYADIVIPLMAQARAAADEIEPLLGEAYKPFPSYEELLFRC